MVRFSLSLSLNPYGNVEVIGDSEATMKALLTYVKTLRHSLGLETTITFSMKKGQTSRVERAIQTREETFSQELEKKMLAKQMKEVKKQMIQTVVEEKSNWGLKIPTNVVRAVTLLLLQHGARGEPIEEVADEKVPTEPYTWWFVIKALSVYTIFVFLCGMYVGYRYRVKLSVYLRTFLRFLRQEETMEFQRQDEFAEVGVIVRARRAANRGEWNLVRRGRNLLSSEKKAYKRERENKKYVDERWSVRRKWRITQNQNSRRQMKVNQMRRWKMMRVRLRCNDEQHTTSSPTGHFGRLQSARERRRCL